ncbi:MAG: alkaline phosphatase [Candidatus Cryptobacteroides sp.]
MNFKTLYSRFLVAAIALPLCLACCRQGEVKPVKNIILMIPDGTSTAVLDLQRWYYEYVEPQECGAALSFDPYICGLVRNHCSNSPMPESSASMSAFMTGQLVQGPNLCIYPAPSPEKDLIKVNPDSTYQPLATVMDAARILKGKALGAVVTVDVTHATPAGTIGHSVSRNSRRTIIDQLASGRMDVLFGGGFKRVNDDVKAILADNGVEYIEADAEAFRKFDGDRLWALFTRSDMSYELERDSLAEPSLAEMTEKAIGMLSRNKNGFFLMVEGSKVDFVAHANDAPGILSEFGAFDRAVAVALDYARKDGNTAVIVVPDHGTAGVNMGDRTYNDYVNKGLDSLMVGLRGIKMTAAQLDPLLRKCAADEIPAVFKENMGIDLNRSEYDALLAARGSSEDDYMKIAYSYNLQHEISKIVQRHTHIGFVSGGHTGEDLFLAVYNPNGQQPTGHLEAADLNEYMCRLAGLPVSLGELTSNVFVKHDVLLAGHSCSVEGEKNDAVLVVDDGVLRIPANRSYVLKGEEKIPLKSVSVYVPENGFFYISREILGLL